MNQYSGVPNNSVYGLIDTKRINEILQEMRQTEVRDFQVYSPMMPPDLSNDKSQVYTEARDFSTSPSDQYRERDSLAQDVSILKISEYINAPNDTFLKQLMDEISFTPIELQLAKEQRVVREMLSDLAGGKQKRPDETANFISTL